VQTRLFGEPVPHRPPREHAPNALANHYRCRDGRWFIMALFNEERQLKPLLNAIGLEDLTHDRRFATKEARKQNAAALVAELDVVFATRDMAEWRTILDSVGVTFGVVGKTDDVAHDAQMQAIGALVPFADGKVLTVSSPFHLEGEEKVAPRYAPTVGQHSEDVLRDAGYSVDEIGRLRTLGVLA
jgi:crotonobetainyl-CoA:carnitine CoA-transferase CaiB-like acyl-CoA transferase